MHVENELAEIVTIGDHEFEEIIEEYEEEVLVHKGGPEPPVTDFAHTSLAQGKPRCITLILNNHWMYIYHVYLRYRSYIETTCIDKPTHESY
jgi:hypothetical protein